MGKILEVDPSSPDERERQLSATVTVFPQFKAILERINQDKPLKKKSGNPDDIFLPKWHISAIIIERLLESEIVVRDDTRACGYRTEYSDICVHFEKEKDRTILAKGASMYASNIEESVTEQDSVENTLFMYFENAWTLNGHQDFFKDVRKLGWKLVEESNKSTKDNSVLRLSISAKIFPTSPSRS